MEIIKFVAYFIIYEELLSSSVFAFKRHIQYKRGNNQANTNELLCGVQKNENKYLAVKMPIGNDSDACQGLGHDWLLDKHYENGFYYIEKQTVKEIFNPPIQVARNGYFWSLPTSFESGASLTIFFTSPMSWTSFRIQICTPSLEIMLYHIALFYDGMSVVDAYTPSHGWKQGRQYQSCPVKNGNMYKISIASHTDIIRTKIDDYPSIDFQHIMHPKNSAFLRMSGNQDTPFLIHNITMIGGN